MMEEQPPAQPRPVSPDTSPDPVKSSLINRLFIHKKLLIITALIIIPVFFIFIYFAGKMVNKAVDNEKSTGGTPNQEELNRAEMKIYTDKDSYSIKEKILVRILADSKGQAVRAFDSVLEYDSEYFILASKGKPLLNDFMYYYSAISESTLQISAFLNSEVAQDTVFTGTPIFEFELKIKKSGKTALKMHYFPESTIDSNIINKESRDILGKAFGKEIEIK